MSERAYFESMTSACAIKAKDIHQVRTHEDRLRRDTQFAGVSRIEHVKHISIPFGVIVCFVLAAVSINATFAASTVICGILYLYWIWNSNSQWLYCRELAREVPGSAEVIASELEVAPTARMAITECLAHSGSDKAARRVLLRILLGDDVGRPGTKAPLHTNALAALLETLPVSDRNGAARLRGWADSVRGANHRLHQREQQIFGALRTLSMIAAILAASSMWIADKVPRRPLEMLGNWGEALHLSFFLAGFLAYLGGCGAVSVWRREVWRD